MKRSYLLFAVLLVGSTYSPFHVQSLEPVAESWREKMVMLMRTKLANSKDIMEGLVTENYGLIARSANEMQRMSNHAIWPRSDDKVYLHINKEFRSQCEKLERHAKNRDQDSTHHTFLRIMSSCVNCHNHVRKSLRLMHDSTRPDSPVRLIPSEWEGNEIHR